MAGVQAVVGYGGRGAGRLAWCVGWGGPWEGRRGQQVAGGARW